MLDVVTVGDAVYDTFIGLGSDEAAVMCPHARRKGLDCFEPVLCLGYGDKIPIEEVHNDIGGSAANVAVGLARQGFKVALYSAIGKDERAKEIIDKLEKENIKTSWILKLKEIKTSFSTIINFKGERTILVHRGLSDYAKLTPLKIPNTKWIFLGPLGRGWEKLYTEITSLASTKGTKLALNPGGIQLKEQGRSLLAILKVASVLFLNKEEAKEILDVKRVAQVKDMLFEIKKMGPEIVVITDGTEGAYVYDGSQYLKIGASSAKRKEATGAGDSFSSGFLGALLLEKGLKEALQWGVIEASGVIQYIGAQKGLQTKAQIEKNLNEAPYPRPI